MALNSTTGDPAGPRPRHDAAADAGHQAAAAQQSRSGGLRGRRTRAQSSARADRGRRGPARGRRPRPPDRNDGEWSEQQPGTGARHRPSGPRRPSRTTYPPADTDAVASRSNADVPPGYSEWGGAGTGTTRREDGDYNLEAFVAAETTLVDHLAEQLTLAVTDPARRMIGQYLIDLVDEAGYLGGDLAQVGEKLGAPLSEVEAVLAILQGFEPAGVCARNLTECLAIQLRERNRFDPAMQALVGHLDLLARRDLAALRKHLRRRRRRPERHDRGNPSAQPEARPGVRHHDGAPDRAGRVRAIGSGRRLAHRAQFRNAAEGPGQPELSRRSRQGRQERQGQELSGRLPADRDLADPRARSARQDHSQGLDRDRAPAGRVLRKRRTASATAQSQDHRGRHQHARSRRCRA